MGSVSSIPHFSHGDADPTQRGGEAESTRSRYQAYFCHDCCRRFYNVGWHAESCGSPDYSRVIARENKERNQ